MIIKYISSFINHTYPCRVYQSLITSKKTFRSKLIRVNNAKIGSVRNKNGRHFRKVTHTNA